MRDLLLILLWVLLTATMIGLGYLYSKLEKLLNEQKPPKVTPPKKIEGKFPIVLNDDLKAAKKEEKAMMFDHGD